MTIIIFSLSEGSNFKNIIFLQSYYQGHIWEDDVYNSFTKGLNQSKIRYKITTKYLDTKRISSDIYYSKLKDLFKIEFQKVSFDLIIANDDNAAKFAIRFQKELFNGAPILFLGVSKYLPQFDSTNNITGIIQSLAFKKTFNLAIQQNPSAKRLLVISDQSGTGLKRYKQIEQILPSLSIKTDAYNNLTLKELVDTLKKSNNKTILYLHAFNRDIEGNTYTNKEVFNEIKKAYHGPIYSVIKEHLELGALGGYLSNGKIHGARGSKIAINLLSGIPANSIPIISDNIDLPEFSYPELFRLKIKEKSLPQRSIIHNRPFSFYKTYKIRIWLVAIIMLLLASIVITLTIYIKIYKKTVHEKMQLQEQLFHKSKMDAIGQLAGGIAHDFNNMLGGIIGATQILEIDGENLTSEQRELITLIFKTSERAADIASKLLSFSRKHKVHSTATAVNQIVYNAVKLLEHTIDKSVLIKCDTLAENDSIIGDNSTIQNVIINLGINAWHAMPNGGKLTISTHNIDIDKNYCKNSKFNINEGLYIGIDIRDTGAGIPKENIEKIFEPFFTTKPEGKGTGLGLAAAYRTVVNHHGEITLYSEIGRGTVFHILLPCNSKQQVKTSTYSTSYDKALTGTVLLVDDEELLRITGAKLLSSMGLTVITAENGEEALSIYNEKHETIDLVISDIIMPKMNGVELFTQLIAINQNIKFIATSGFVKDESIDELKNMGLHGFISKPYHKHELYNKISEVL